MNATREQTRPLIYMQVDLERQGAFYKGLMVTPSILLGVLVAFVFLIPPATNERLTFGESINSFIIIHLLNI